MQALRQPGMRDRHWDQISTECDIKLKPDKHYTMTKALEAGLMDHLEVIQRVRAVSLWCQITLKALYYALIHLKSMRILTYLQRHL